MRSSFLMFNSGAPDPHVAHTAFFVEQVSLLLVIQFAVLNLLSGTFKFVGHIFPTILSGMPVGSALAVLASTAALIFTENKPTRRFRWLGKGFACFTAGMAATYLSATYWSRLEWMQWLVPRDRLLQPESAAAICLVLLGIAVLLVPCRNSLRAYVADIAASCLTFVVLILSSESLFAAANVPGASSAGLPSPTFLLCSGLLTLVVILRRARHGIFSVFLGNGIGGRIARILAPIVIVINLGRELGRARILDADLVPHRFANSVLVSIAIVIGFSLLILLCRIINGMQAEIENLTLRDELTGLYSYRGFNLFAEQAYRLARRAGQPFGVLFVDMDNLKRINDELGHPEGSACLVEVARLLASTFRETEVIGRLGGDEFVVAGQFDEASMSQAMERLRSSQLKIPGLNLPLSLSMGYAASEGGSDERMKSILSRADKAMYREKRAKKRVLPASLSSTSYDVAGGSLAPAEANGPGERTVTV